MKRNFCVEAGPPARFDTVLGPEREGPIDVQPDAQVPLAPPPVPSADALSSSQVQEAVAFGRRTTKLKA